VAKNPSTRWYFNDWRTDTAVMACSDAAQGFWAWLLCICAESGGYLRIGGKAPTIIELATLRGRDKRTIQRQLVELEKAGVFSRTEDGTIYNRRMVRDGEAEKAKRASRLGAEVGAKRVNILHREPEANQPETLEDFEKTRTRASALDSDSGSFASSQDSSQTDNSESLNAAREGEGEDLETRNPEEGRCAPLGGSFGGRCHPEPGPDAVPVSYRTARPRSPPEDGVKTRTPVGIVRPALYRDGGTDDADPSSQAPTSDYRDLGLKCKCRSGGPAGTCERSPDAQSSEVPVHHYPVLAPARQDRDNALNGEGQSATVDPSRRGDAPVQAASRTTLGAVAILGRPQRCTKSPALRAKIRDQLMQKHHRYLAARKRPEALAAYWTAQLGDDAAEAQHVFDAVDRLMRAERWDDEREHEVAA
jgi:hypothetical protein